MIRAPRSHSALKWMAEARAKLAGDLARLKDLQVQLAADVADTERKLEAMNAALRLFDPSLNPEAIPPKRNYTAKRSQLNRTLLSVLAGLAPRVASTAEVALITAERMNLDFKTPEDYRLWKTECVGRALRTLVSKGRVLRQKGRVLNEQGLDEGDCRWSLAPQEAAAGLETLREQANAAGIGLEAGPPAVDANEEVAR